MFDTRGVGRITGPRDHPCLPKLCHVTPPGAGEGAFGQTQPCLGYTKVLSPTWDTSRELVSSRPFGLVGLGLAT